MSRTPATLTLLERFSSRWLFAIVLLGSGCVLQASATPITYQLTGNFTGTLGSTVLSGPVTFQLVSDTVGVQDLGGYSINTTGVSTLSANGQTATFLSPTFGVESEYFSAEFGDTSTFSFGANAYSFDIMPDAIATAGSTYTGAYNSLLTGSTQTSLGALTITGATGDVTFQTLNATTPEPSSLLLLGTGALGCVTALRRRMSERNGVAAARRCSASA